MKNIMNSIKNNSLVGLHWLWITIFVMAIDRYTKFWMLHHLTYQEPFQVLPIFNFTLNYNTGAAFGFLNTAPGWQNLLLGGIALSTSIFLIFWIVKVSMQSRWITAALCLILGGAIGNVWDRVLYGHVIDFLSFHYNNLYFAIFNIADSAIFLGAVILFWCSFRKKSLDRSQRL